MDYKKIYHSLCYKTRSRSVDGYYETHHIIPKCLGGSDSPENLVDLTPEEHYLAHQLLVKIYPNNYALAKAAAMMIPNRPSNKLYGWIKRRHSIAMSIQQSGVNNTQYGKRWISNKDLCQSKRIYKIEPLPSGWIEGRIVDWDKATKQCKYCHKSFTDNTPTEYCSKKCKTYFRAPHFKIIDDNIDDMIALFIKLKSITKVLKEYGIENKKGNSYLSAILKKHRLPILRRRNSADIA